MAIISGSHCRVHVNGQDISKLCRAFDIRAEVGHVMTARLELICSVRMDGQGNIFLGETPDDADTPLRAMTFGSIPT